MVSSGSLKLPFRKYSTIVLLLARQWKSVLVNMLSPIADKTHMLISSSRTAGIFVWQSS